MSEEALPMGKTITCHHGKFTLPSEIYGVDIGDDKIIFYCEEGPYEAKHENGWKIVKV